MKNKKIEQILSTLLFVQHSFTTLLPYKRRRYYVLEYKIPSPVLLYNMNAMPCEKKAVEGELFLECIRKWASAESRGASRRRGACAKCKTILCHQGNPILRRSTVGKCFWSWRGEEKKKRGTRRRRRKRRRGRGGGGELRRSRRKVEKGEEGWYIRMNGRKLVLISGAVHCALFVKW